MYFIRICVFIDTHYYLIHRLQPGGVLLTHPSPPTCGKSKYCHAQCYLEQRAAKTAKFESKCKRCKQIIPRNSPIESFQGGWSHVGCSEQSTPATGFSSRDVEALAAAARVLPDDTVLGTALSFESSVRVQCCVACVYFLSHVF